MTMKAHTYYIIFGRPPIGGKASRLAAPLTTAEKLGGPHDALHSPPPSLPRLPLLLHPCLTHSLPCSSFLLPLNLARRSVDWKHCKLPAVPSEKRQPVAVGGGDQIHLVRCDFQSWRGRGRDRPKRLFSVTAVTETGAEIQLLISAVTVTRPKLTNDLRP